MRQGLRWDCIVLLVALAVAPAYGQGDDKDVREVREGPNGNAYCFEPRLVISTVVIAGNRCYTFYFVRTSSGAFLGLAPGGPPLIVPGQLVRLDTPVGIRARRSLVYMVPLSTGVALRPVETIQAVIVQVSTRRARSVITVPQTGERPVEVAFDRR